MQSSAPPSASWISWPLAFLFASSDDGPKSNVPIRYIESDFFLFLKSKPNIQNTIIKWKQFLLDFVIWMQRCAWHHRGEIQQLVVGPHHRPKMKIAIQLPFAAHRNVHQYYNANAAHLQTRMDAPINEILIMIMNRLNSTIDNQHIILTLCMGIK